MKVKNPEPSPTLILGTAMWAWNIERKKCFRILDEFYAAGFRQVDAATNYPINKNPDDFRASENILLEWIKSHGVEDLEVIMKVGSVNNLYTPENNLRKSFLLLCLDDYRHRLGNNLDTFMIHWDNREQTGEIRESLEALKIAKDLGLQTGLSGIKHPEVYREINQSFHLDFRIQIKHNLWYSDYKRYRGFHDKKRFLAYGINAGGIKFEIKNYGVNSTFIIRGGHPQTLPLQQKLKEMIPVWNAKKYPLPIKSFNQIAMLNAFHHPGISGILIGPSSVEQLENSLDVYRTMLGGAYLDLYQELQHLPSQNI